MLQKIRSNLQGVVAYLIVGFLVLVFALWGVEAFFLGESSVDVAEVNGETISELELNQAIYRQRQQLLARMGDQADPSQIDETMLRGPVLQELIGQRLLRQQALANDLVVSEAMANQHIRQRPEFQIDGVFSQERFDALVRANAMTPAKYRAVLIDDLQINQMLTGLAGSAVVTERELEMMFAVMEQKRDIETAVLRAELGRKQVELDEGEADTYYREHGDEFLTEEQIQVEFIEMRLADFYPEVDEQSIVAAYEASIAQLESTERRRAAHILLEKDAVDDDEAQALLQALTARLAAGEAFADLAREYSDDLGSKNNGGDLGFSDGTAFPEAFEQALGQLAVDQVSEPMKTDAGWHLIQLTEIEAVEVPGLDERREELRAQLQLETAEPAYAVKLEELKDVSFNAADLTSVGQALAFEVQTSAFFDRDGVEAGVFADQRVLAEAFSDSVIGEGMNSEVVELSPGHAVVLRLVERQEPEAIPFAEVQEQIEERLLSDEAAAYLKARAQALEVALRDGQALSELSAEQEGIEYAAHAGLSRQGVSDADPDLVAAAFRMSPPGDEVAVAIENLLDGSVAVIVLTKVEPGSLEDLDDAKRVSLRQALNRYRTQSVVGGYRQALQQGADIEFR